MRKLSEIVTAVRLGDPVETSELVYAVVAFDVLLAQLDLPNDVVRLQKYMQAAVSDPRVYVSPENDPAEPVAVEWYRTFMNIKAPRLCANCDCELPAGCDGTFAGQPGCEGWTLATGVTARRRG